MSVTFLAHTVLTDNGADPSMWTSLSALEIPAAEKVVRTVAVYLAILLLVRVAGKRLMAQMSSLDLVVVLLLSNVVQNAIIGPDNSVVGGLLGAVVLVGVNAALDRLVDRYGWLGALLQGGPSVVVRDGEVDKAVLHRLGMSDMELRSALRHQGADEIGEVARAELEPGGGVVIDLKPGERNVSRDELRAAMAEITRLLDERLPPDQRCTT